MRLKTPDTLSFTEQDVLALEASVLQDSLYDFVTGAWGQIESSDYIDNWHVHSVCEHLEAVTSGQIKNLLVNIPPGCSKSLITCVFWPAWVWAKNPSARWMFASYDQQLSTRDSVRVRSLIHSEWYRERWPNKVKLAKDQDQKTYYETLAGGYRLATTPRGHGTGEHPDFLVCDDPHNTKQAESQKERQSVLDWWDLTVSTRGVSRGVRKVIIMQRLHEKDLSGHVLAKGGFVHLKLPMRYVPGKKGSTSLPDRDPRKEEGELLAPEQFPEEATAEMEKSLGPYGTAGQLQQEPSPREGGLFKAVYFNNRVRTAPYESRRIRFWDRAASHNKGKRTAGVLMAADKEGSFYVEHVHKGQWDPKQRNDEIVSIAHRDRLKYGPKYEPVIWVEGERGSTGKESFQHLARRLAGFQIREDLPTGDKQTRATPLADQFSAGNVYLVDGGGKSDWDLAGYIQELLLFPNGEFADQIDASSGAFNLLSGRKLGRVLSVHSLGLTKKDSLVVAVVDFEGLAVLDSPDKAVLIYTSDHPPLDRPTLPDHHLTSLLAHHKVVCSSIQPVDYQDRWDEPIAPYDKPCRDLMMSMEEGRKLWAFILKKRDPNPRLLVIADDGGGLGLSLAQGIADGLSLPRGMIQVEEGGPKPDGAPPNKHVYDTVRAARARVSA